MQKIKFTTSNFLTPEVHKIINSLSSRCFKIKITNVNKKDSGINFGTIPNKLRIEY